MTSREVLALVLVVSAPWVLALLVALLRGYDITLIIRRDNKGRPPP